MRPPTALLAVLLGLAAAGPSGARADSDCYDRAQSQAELTECSLPEIRPTGFNYPVDLLGRWRGDAYSFVVRFRSGFPENPGEEFDAPFARIEHRGGKFAVDWMRHTGRWWRLREGLPFEEALAMVADEPVLRPPV